MDHSIHENKRSHGNQYCIVFIDNIGKGKYGEYEQANSIDNSEILVGRLCI